MFWGLWPLIRPTTEWHFYILCDLQISADLEQLNLYTIVGRAPPADSTAARQGPDSNSGGQAGS